MGSKNLSPGMRRALEAIGDGKTHLAGGRLAVSLRALERAGLADLNLTVEAYHITLAGLNKLTELGAAPPKHSKTRDPLSYTRHELWMLPISVRGHVIAPLVATRGIGFVCSRWEFSHAAVEGWLNAAGLAS